MWCTGVVLHFVSAFICPPCFTVCCQTAVSHGRIREQSGAALEEGAEHSHTPGLHIMLLISCKCFLRKNLTVYHVVVAVLVPAGKGTSLQHRNKSFEFIP